MGAFKCVCKPGFIGDVHNYTDIDECLQNHNCSENANCSNTEGSHNCFCFPGFSGDGHKCEDIDECSQNSHNCSYKTATCNNSEGSFKCICKPGFSGDGHNCTDIDECVNHTHNCSKGSATCTNTEVSFNCSCNPGFTGDGYTCQDIDECTENTHNCTHGNSICENNKGSFKCVCKPKSRGAGNDCRVSKDCAEAYKKGQYINGIYTIDPDGEGSFDVFCNQTRGQGGWTVFQRKQSHSIDFNRNWTDYKNGFGNLSENFWLGLDKVHRLTRSDNYKLVVYWKKGKDSFHYHFDQFEVESEEACYKVMVEGSGSDWGPLKDSNGQSFATRDQDSNGHTGHMCVGKCGIGWWYNSSSCHCPLGHPISAAKGGMIIRPTNFSPTLKTTPRRTSG